MNSFGRQPLSVPADETVRWSGVPRRGMILKGSDWFAIPFSLLWGGMVFVFVSGALRSHDRATWFPLFGIPFVAIGLYLILGRFWWDANLRARTRYVVTDRAAYIVVSGLLGSTQRYSGAGLDSVRVERKADGAGSLRFGPDVSTRDLLNSTLFPMPRPMFEAIGDVDGAYAAVRAAERV